MSSSTATSAVNSPTPSNRNSSFPSLPNSPQTSSFSTDSIALIQTQQWHQLLDLAEQRELDDLGLLGRECEVYYAVQLIVPFMIDQATAAKFAWKRTAMNESRKRFPLLAIVWKGLTPLYQHEDHLFFQSFSGTIQAIQSTQSPTIPTVLQLLYSLHSVIRDRAILSIERIYEAISVDAACKMTGLDASKLMNCAQQRGWTAISDEGSGQFLRPVRPVVNSSIQVDNRQLSQLTDYVMTLDL